MGLVTAACLASKNNDVRCVEIDAPRVAKINAGETPFFEPGLSELVKSHAGRNLRATTSLRDGVEGAEVICFCLPTPPKQSGEIELKYFEDAARKLAAELKKLKTEKKLERPTVVVRSTVLPGTTRGILFPIIEKAGLKPGRDVGAAMNPEFLREGNAVQDFLRPDKIVVGADDEESGAAAARMYAGFEAPVVRTSLNAAEMIKYANNAFLASRVSLINEFARLCEKRGVDVGEVARAIGLDKRIGPLFLDAGAGWGGSCWRKDVSAIAHAMRAEGLNDDAAAAILRSNEEQAKHAVALVRDAVGGSLEGKRIAVLGLAFKPLTDDVRDSSSLRIIAALAGEGAEVRAHDPRAIENARRALRDPGEFGWNGKIDESRVCFCDSLQEALRGADACLLATAWPDYAELQKELSVMRERIVVDGRRFLNAAEMRAAGAKLTVLGVGVA